MSRLLTHLPEFRKNGRQAPSLVITAEDGLPSACGGPVDGETHKDIVSGLAVSLVGCLRWMAACPLAPVYQSGL